MLQQMNERIKQLAEQAGYLPDMFGIGHWDMPECKKFAESIVRECVNREELLSAIARGWCSEKNSHKIMDSDLALAIFDEVEQQIKQHFGVKE
jgi:hypothetical protein